MSDSDEDFSRPYSGNHRIKGQGNQRTCPVHGSAPEQTHVHVIMSSQEFDFPNFSDWNEQTSPGFLHRRRRYVHDEAQAGIPHRIRGQNYQRPCPKHGSTSEKNEENGRKQTPVVAAVQDNVSSQPSDAATTSDPEEQTTPSCILYQSVTYRTEGSTLHEAVTETWFEIMQKGNGRDKDPILRACCASQQFELDASRASQLCGDSTTSDPVEDTPAGSLDHQAQSLNHRIKGQGRKRPFPIHGSTSEQKEESGQNQSPVQGNVSVQLSARLSAPSQSASSEGDVNRSTGNN